MMCDTESVTENLFDPIFNRHSVKKIIHVNVEITIANRKTFLKTFNNEIFYIIALSETFLKPAVSSVLFITTYIIMTERVKREGWAGCLHKKGLNYKIICA